MWYVNAFQKPMWGQIAPWWRPLAATLRCETASRWTDSTALQREHVQVPYTSVPQWTPVAASGPGPRTISFSTRFANETCPWPENIGSLSMWQTRWNVFGSFQQSFPNHMAEVLQLASKKCGFPPFPLSQNNEALAWANTTAVWCRSKRHPDILATVDTAPWPCDRYIQIQN